MADAAPPGFEPTGTAPPGWEPSAAPASPPMGFGESMRLGAGPRAVAETMGLGRVANALGMPGALGLRPEARPAYDVLLNPQSLGEGAAAKAAQAPFIAAGGGAGALMSASRLAPIAGRLAASGALGAAKGAAKGENPLYGAAKDVAGAGVAEALVPGLGSIPGAPAALKDFAAKAASAAKVGQWASEAPAKVVGALARIDPRYATSRFTFPLLGKQAITVEEAAKAIGKLEGTEYQITRDHIVKALDAVDRASRVPQDAMKRFLDSTPEFVRAKSGTEKAFNAVTGSNSVRSLADAAADQKPEVPIGAAASYLTPSSFGSAASHLAPHMMR